MKAQTFCTKCKQVKKVKYGWCAECLATEPKVIARKREIKAKRARYSLNDQREFESGIKERHESSLGFLASIRNSVAKQEFWRSRPKTVSKSLAGEVLGRVSVSHEARESAARAEANRALLRADMELVVGDLHLSWDDDELCNWARAKAERCAREIKADKCAHHVLRWLVNSVGFNWPAVDLFGDQGAELRVQDERWWRRRARVAKARVIDQLARSFRMVHAKAQVYVSNEAAKLRAKQAKRNRAILEGFEAVNQDGDVYSLAALADLSVSNPVNRRNELMVRIRGFEEVAEQFGHEGLFITMAAPSSFHPMRQIKNKFGRLVRVTENKNYGTYGRDRYTPRQAQEWLCKTWALIRAEFARQGIRCYGFRVVEPHHDGCPHWHQLLFFKKYDLDAAERIYKRYMMRTDGFERGAGNRLKIITIDKSRGTAAGYIAKYIAKSIDGMKEGGESLGEDLLGNESVSAAGRICAWASTWGIRQFQQIGGPSVTVWRELRRLAEVEGEPELMRAAREAADASNWAAFCLVQGDGLAFFGRDEQQVRPVYRASELIDLETGELTQKPNRYGEPSVVALFGVVLVAASKVFISRVHDWVVRRVSAAAELVQKVAPEMSADDLLDFMRGDGSGSINREAIASDLCQ